MKTAKLFCPDFQLCKIASLTDFDLSGEEGTVLGRLKVPVLRGTADADGQNVGAGEEQRVPKAWTCWLDQVRSTLQLQGNEVGNNPYPP